MFSFSAAVAAAFRQPAPDAERSARVRRQLDPQQSHDTDSFLVVGPPDGFTRSCGEFIAAVCDDLFGLADVQIRFGKNDDAMRRAIARARAGLAVARERYLRGELVHQRQLMVKYSLENEHGREFPWACVT